MATTLVHGRRPWIDSADQATQRRFRGDIEGLRAVAVLSVVLFHAGFPLIPGGFVGVDVFFVISGFLITGLMLREIGTTDRLSLVRFYARRVRRLVPMATTVIIATLVASAFILPYGTLQEIGVAAGASATFWANWYFAAQAGDYFGGDVTTNPFLHFWSLSAEEQFYVIWPLLILGIAVLCVRRGLNRRLRRTLLASALVGITGISLAASLTADGSESSYFLLQTRLWELGFGALVALAATHLGRLPALVTLVAGWLGVALIAWAVITFDENTIFPGSAALVPVVGASLVIIAGISSQQGDRHVSRYLSVAPMQYVGARSYNLYLWHWPVLVLTAAVLVPPAQATSVDSALARTSFVSVLIALVLTALLTVWSYRLIEQPMREALGLVVAPKALIAGGVAILLTVLAAFAVPSLAPSPANSATDAGRVVASAEEARSENTAALDEACADVVAAADDQCTSGSDAGGHRIALIGDSHAAMWTPALSPLGRTYGWQIRHYMRPACWFAATPAGVQYGDDALQQCASKNEASYRALGESEQFEAVIVARFQRYFDRVSNQGVDEETMVAQARASFRALSRITSTVIVLRDPPLTNFDVPACLESAGGDPQACSFNRWSGLEDDEQLTDIEVRGAQGVPGLRVQFVSTAQLFCAVDETTCSPVDSEGNVIYSDNHHLSAKAVRAVRGELDKLLQKHAPNLYRAPALAG